MNRNIEILDKTNGQSGSVAWGDTQPLSADIVKLQLSPADLESLVASEQNLIVTLKNGDQITLKDFFMLDKDGIPNELILEDSDGVIRWGQRNPSSGDFTFAEISSVDDLVLLAQGGAGIPTWLLVGGLAVLGAGGVALAAGGGSGSDGDGDSSANGDSSPVIRKEVAVFNDDGSQISGRAEPDSTIMVRNEAGDEIGSATAGMDGRYVIDIEPAMTNGEAVFVSETGSDGASSEWSMAAPDTTAPVTPGAIELAEGSDSGAIGDGVTNDPTPTVRGSGGATGDTVTLYDTDGISVLGTAVVNANGDWAVTTSTLDDGDHSLTVTYTDPSGNVSLLSPAMMLTIDRAAPAAPELALGSDSGVVGDNITNDATPTLTGSGGAPGDTVTLYDTDGISVLGTGIVAADGTWSITASELDENSHGLSASFTDQAGNESALSIVTEITVDTQSPVAPTAPDLDAASDTGTSNSDDITGDDTPMITGNGGDPGNTVTLYDTDGTSVLGTGVVASDGTWSVTSSELGEGSHSLTTSFTDPAGNESALSAVTGITVDTQSPVAPTAPDLDAASDTGTSNSDDVTGNDTPTITGNGGAPGDTVTLYDTDSVSILGTSVVAADGTWSITTSELGEDSHNLTASFTDQAGNESVLSAVTEITVDTQSPVAPTAPDLDAASDTGTSNSDNVTGNDTPAITGSGGASGDTVTLYDTDGTTVLGNAIVAADGSWSVAVGVVDGETNAAITLADGVHELAASYTDSVGNESALSATTSIVVDTQSPSTSTAPDLDAASDTGASDNDDITSDTTPTITGSGGTPGDTITLYDTDGTTVLGNATIAADGNWSVTVGIVDGEIHAAITLADGVHALAASYTDSAGNESALSATTEITVDTQSPDTPTAPDLDAISDTGASDTDDVTSDTTPTLTGSGGTPGDTVTLYDTDGTSVLGAVVIAPDGTWSVTASELGEGNHDLTASFTDQAGNESALSAVTTVKIDSSTPTAPAAPTLDSGAAGDGITNASTPTVTGDGSAEGDTITLYDTDGTTVLGTDVVATDGSWSITSSSLADGNHNLTVTATDLAGNPSPVSAITPVTIDTTAPDVPTITNANGYVFAGTAGAGEIVTLTDTTDVNNPIEIGTAQADASGNWLLHVDPASPVSDGTDITARAQDAAGNEASSTPWHVDLIAAQFSEANFTNVQTELPTIVGALLGDRALVTGAVELDEGTLSNVIVDVTSQGQLLTETGENADVVLGPLPEYGTFEVDYQELAGVLNGVLGTLTGNENVLLGLTAEDSAGVLSQTNYYDLGETAALLEAPFASLADLLGELGGLVLGGDSPLPLVGVGYKGSDGHDLITGSGVSEQINALGGDDVLVGNGGADILNGGYGLDLIDVPDLTFESIDGGADFDTLYFSGGDLTADLSTLDIANMEAFDLRGSGDVDLSISLDDLVNTTDHSTSQLYIWGDSDDSVTLSADFDQNRTDTFENAEFQVYTSTSDTDNNELWVQSSLTIV